MKSLITLHIQMPLLLRCTLPFIVVPGHNLEGKPSFWVQAKAEAKELRVMSSVSDAHAAGLN